jgi:dihydrofolate reductase
MIISLIVAAAENGVIGNAGTMPWRMPSDLKRFRTLTIGKPVVMGRKTFQSLPKPLDGRDNIVITRDPHFMPEGATVVGSLDAALEIAAACATRRGTDEIMVIGGGEIYRQALPLANRIYLTQIQAKLVGDTSFPELPASIWRLERSEPLPKGEKDEYAATLLVYEKHAAA